VSGFAAIVNFDGEPVDRALLERMAAYLAFRGPDEQRVWVGGWNGNVGLVHAKFATTDEAEREHQPLNVDGNAWITGHIRVDARDEMRDRLAGRRREGLASATDAELLLHAYAADGTACVDRLLGEFGFALWDERARRLWCATDHMGIRPVFHERHGSTVVVSNTLDCVRLHPASCGTLGEQAIADFLVHDFNPDPTTTVYEAIRRVAPGVAVAFTSDGVRLRAYSQMPADDPVLGRTPDAVVEEFRDLLGKAVKDRIRTRRIAIYLSGGIDSATLAAAAASTLPEPGRHVVGFCLGFRRLIQDDECRYAQAVADRLGIELRSRYRDDACFDPDWHEKRACPPEPTTHVWSFDEDRALQREVASTARVAFYGEGPDNALRYDWEGYLGHLARKGKWQHAARGLWQHMGARRPATLPGAAAGWLKRKLIGRVARPTASATRMPAWINRELAARLRLAEADPWASRNAGAAEHPWRQDTYRLLASNLWRRLFDRFDPAMYGVPAEARHPYLDQRLLRFFLALPVIPWCRDKYVMREAMARTLPAEVLSRRKTTLSADPVRERVKALRYRYPQPRATAKLGTFIEPGALPVGPAGLATDYHENLRLFAFDQWLAEHDVQRKERALNWDTARFAS
jgi:asparagine synthase (glutamine-hydrolysing)